jgi:exonuclease III
VCSDRLDPLVSHHRGQGGVAILYKTSLQHVVSALDIEDDRICGLRIKLENGSWLNIFMVYLPSSNYAISTFDDYIEKLHDIYNTYHDDENECLIMGDFNSEITDNALKSDNSRCQKLTSFANDCGFLSVNVQLKCEGPSYTFDPLEDHTVTTMIDHVLIDKNHITSVERCIIVDSDYNPSDHLPIIATLSFSNCSETNKEYQKEYIQWQKYSDDEIQLRYTNHLAHQLAEVKKPAVEACDTHTLENYYDNISSCMHRCAREHIGVKTNTNCTSRKPFWCRELQLLYRQMGASRKMWRMNGKLRGQSSATYVKYKDDKRKFRKELREKQEAWESKYFDKVEQVAEIDQSKFWYLIKKKRQKGPPKHYEMQFENKTCTLTSEIVDGWAQYFSKLYSPLCTEEFDEEFKQRVKDKLNKMLEEDPGYCELLDMDISVDEILGAVRELPIKKAGGYDRLTYEHIKYGGTELYYHLSHLFSLMLSTQTVPCKMKQGLTTTLLKPGKKVKSLPDNYRGITLLPVLYKLFEKVTLKRMVLSLDGKDEVFPDPLQCAYQKLLSSLNATFSIQETINYNLERGSKVFVCLMDNRKAFDLVWHDGLFVLLHQLGIKNRL